MSTKFNTKIGALLQVDKIETAKRLLNLVNYKYKVNFRTLTVVSNDKNFEFEIHILVIINDYYAKICGKSYNLICFSDILQPNTKARIISRARLLPREIYNYGPHCINTFDTNHDLYNLCESIKYQLNSELYT